jgi:hypothetical protein
MSTNIQQVTDHQIICQIITSDNQLVDVSDQVMHLNFYESIFSPCVTGDIVFGDGLSLSTVFGFQGNEIVYLYLDKPSDPPNPIKKYFRLYKSSNRTAESQSIQNYKLNFCSEELILSSQFYVRKSYRGTTIDKIILDILNSYLKVDSSKIDSNNFEKPSASDSFIVPRMRPLEAILWLASRAYGNNRNNYFFFENRDGFNFVSYEKLISAKPYNTYFWQPNTTVDPSTNIFSIYYMNTDDYDILNSNRYGQFASTLYTFDILTRQYNNTSINGTQYTAPNRLLNPHLPQNLAKNRLANTLYQSIDSYVKFIAITDSDKNVNPLNPQNWVLYDSMKLAQLQLGTKIQIVIPSDFNIKSGMVVNLNLPLMVPQSEGKEEQFDRYRTAKFLVTHVKHGISGDISSTTLELVSDSLDKQPPIASNSGVIQKAMKL